jgi:hypothetical protein
LIVISLFHPCSSPASPWETTTVTFYQFINPIRLQRIFKMAQRKAHLGAEPDGWSVVDGTPSYDYDKALSKSMNKTSSQH